MFLTGCIVLIIYPQARMFLFPPAPIALVDSLSGGVTKPKAGMLGSVNSATGAPEHFKGEAVENEASNFVTGLGAIAASVCSGRDPHGEPNTEEDRLNAPSGATPGQLAMMVESAKSKAMGVDKPSEDKTKEPMISAMWSAVLPMMHALSKTSNIWERFANLLHPYPPFHVHNGTARLQLAAAILPLAITSIFVSRDLVFRSATFVLGAMLFGQPVITPVSHFVAGNLARCFASLQNSPTNSQLALVLLRLGEYKSKPIPPCPHIKGPPPKIPLELAEDVFDTTWGDQPLGASEHDLKDAIAVDEETYAGAGGNDVEVATSDDDKEPHKVLKLAKRATKVGVRTFLAIDKIRAKTGNTGAKNRAGVVPSKHDKPIAGPREFNARWEGDVGFLYLDSSKSAPTISFNTVSATERNGIPDSEVLRPVWSLPINDIIELRKHSGLGFKTKLVAGWALDKELSDGLGITNKLGKKWAVTAIPHRDALFNRLIAIGEQKWEMS